MHKIAHYCMIVLFVLIAEGVSQSIEFDSGSSLQYRGNLGYLQWYYPKEKTGQNQPDFVSTIKGSLFLTYQFGELPIELVLNPRFVFDPTDDSFERKGVHFMGKGRNRLLIDDLYLDLIQETVELRMGYQIFSWKTVESVSWADFLNQVDRQYDLLDPDKIGELATRARFISPFGDESTLEFYYLPWFTPTTHVQQGSRGYVLPLSNEYESIEYGATQKRWRPQGAIRFSSTAFEDVDFSLFYFQGYDRDVLPTFDVQKGLLQKYEIIHRMGLTFQGALDAWLIKGEIINTIYDSENFDSYKAATTGVEYTINALLFDNQDVGLIAELIATSDWGEDPSTLGAFRPFNNHLFTGVRYSFNTISDRSLLLGVFSSFENYEWLMSAEYQERIFELLTVKIGAMALIAEEVSMMKQLEHLARLEADVQWNF
ncbi:MAG: hypothetical protein OCD01_15230 [Fibrobacterales bacterium]